MLLSSLTIRSRPATTGDLRCCGSAPPVHRTGRRPGTSPPPTAAHSDERLPNLEASRLQAACPATWRQLPRAAAVWTAPTPPYRTALIHPTRGRFAPALRSAPPPRTARGEAPPPEQQNGNGPRHPGIGPQGCFQLLTVGLTGHDRQFHAEVPRAAEKPPQRFLDRDATPSAVCTDRCRSRRWCRRRRAHGRASDELADRGGTERARPPLRFTRPCWPARPVRPRAGSASSSRDHAGF